MSRMFRSSNIKDALKNLFANADKEGLLEKRGTGINKNYKERYFRLKGEYMWYFHDKDKDPHGVIRLKEAKIQRGEKNEDDGAFWFTIDTPARMYTIKCENHEQMDDWIEAIEEHRTYNAKEGMVRKKGAINPMFRDRFMVLQDHLYYFKDEDDPMPQGFIELSPKVKTENDEEEEIRFNIVTPDRTWEVEAQDVSDKLEWVEIIQRVCDEGPIPRAEITKTQVAQESGGDPEGVRHLHVRICRAKDIRAADVGGASDPYVTVKFLGEKSEFKTKVLKKTLNPEWLDAQFVLRSANPEEQLQVQVWDENTFSSATFLGEAIIPMADVKSNIPTVEWYDLQGRTEASSSSGTTDDDEKVEGKIQLELMTSRSKEAPKPSYLHVNVFNARDLPAVDTLGGASDPFVTVKFVEGQQEFKTAHIDNETNPEWDQEYDRFDIINPSDNVLVQVWDFNKMLKNTLLGEVVVPLEELPFGTPVNKWYKLQKPEDSDVETTGDVRIQLCHTFVKEPPKIAPPSEGPFVHASVYAARNLVAADTLGTSDPYVVIMLTGEVRQHRTETLSRTLAPEWEDEKFLLEVMDESAKIWIRVFDSDKMSGDDPLGEAFVPLSDLQKDVPFNEWVKLSKVEGMDEEIEDCGEVHVKLTFADTKKEPEAYYLHVHVIEAKGVRAADIGGTSDPYANLRFIGSRLSQETAHVEKTLDPEWDAEHLVLQVREKLDVATLELSVMDYDRIGSNDCLGATRIDLNTLEFEEPLNEWYDLHELEEDPTLAAASKIGKKLKEAKDKVAESSKDAADAMSTAHDVVTDVVGTDFSFRDFLGLGKIQGQVHLETVLSRYPEPPGSSFVHASVFGCKDLPAADLGFELFGKQVGGSSDPFVVLKMTSNPDEYRTEIVKCNVNPEWDEESFSLPVYPETVESADEMVEIEVYDYDWASKNDLLGTAQVSLQELRQHQDERQNMWVDLKNPEGEAAGKIHLELTFSDSRVPPPRVYLHVNVYEARDIPMPLVGKRDPYIKVGFENGMTEYETVKSSECDEVDFSHDEQYRFTVADPNDNLVVTVWDYDKLTEDDVITQLKVALEDLPMEEYHNKFFDLDDGGRLHMQLWKTHERVAPDNMYVHVNVFEARDLVPVDMGGKADPYVTAMVEGRLDYLKTSTIKKTLNPDWGNEEHNYFETTFREPNVIVRVFDHDMISSDDVLGHVVVPIGDFEPDLPVHKWFKLTSEDGEQASGDIRMQLTWTTSIETPYIADCEQDAFLHVSIYAARDLMSMDANGKADPFVLVKLVGEEKEYETPVVEADLTPQWHDQDFRFNVTSEELELDIIVYDKDKISGADFMGQTRIPLSRLHMDESINDWFKLTNEGGESSKSGASSRDIESGEVHAQITMSKSRKPPKNRYMHVQVFSARDLVPVDAMGLGSADPFVTLKFSGLDQEFETEIVKGTLEPEWTNQHYILPAQDNTAVLTLTVWDWDRLSGNDFLGQVQIPVADLEEDKPIHKFYPLGRDMEGEYTKADVSGDLEVQVCYSTDKDRPGISELLEPAYLHCFVFGATVDRGLFNAGKMDPYCIVKFEGQQLEYRTKKISNTDVPDYNESFKLEVTNEEANLEVILMDHDAITRDDKICQVSIPLPTLEREQPLMEWFDMDKDGCKVRMLLMLSDGHVPPERTFLHINVVEARDLADEDIMGQCDPFVKVHMKDRELYHKSEVVKGGDRNPVFNGAQFILDIHDPSESLIVEVWDYDRLTSNDSLGTFEIDLSPLEIDSPSDEWYAVEGDGAEGEVHVQLCLSHNPGADGVDFMQAALAAKREELEADAEAAAEAAEAERKAKEAEAARIAKEEADEAARIAAEEEEAAEAARIAQEEADEAARIAAEEEEAAEAARIAAEEEAEAARIAKEEADEAARIAAEEEANRLAEAEAAASDAGDAPIMDTPLVWRSINYDNQCFTLANDSDDDLELAGWRINSNTGNFKNYSLPEITLEAGQEMNIWCGSDAPSQLDEDSLQFMFTTRDVICHNDEEDVWHLINPDNESVHILTLSPDDGEVTWNGEDADGGDEYYDSPLIIRMLDLKADCVTLVNVSGEDLDVTDWEISSEGGNYQMYKLEEGLVLEPDQEVNIYSGTKNKDKHDPPSSYLWTKRYIWADSGDCAILKNPDGEEVQRLECSKEQEVAWYWGASTEQHIVIETLHLPDDYVTVANIGGTEEDLSGWVIASEGGGNSQEYTFEDQVLGPGESITVYSGKKNEDQEDGIFWTGRYIWSDKGDEAVLYNADGEEVDRLACTRAQQVAFYNDEEGSEGLADMWLFWNSEQERHVTAANDESMRNLDEAEFTTMFHDCSVVEYDLELEGMATLSMYFFPETNEMYPIADETSIEEATEAGGYAVRVEGYVFKEEHDDLVPLNNFYNEETGDTLVSAHPASEATAEEKGYEFVRVEGYVYPAGFDGDWLDAVDALEEEE